MLTFSTYTLGAEQRVLAEAGNVNSRSRLIIPTDQATVDHFAGPTGGIAGQTLTGTSESAAQGRDVVVEALASHAGATLLIQESADGTTWTTAGSFPLPSGYPAGVRFTPGPFCAFYRPQVHCAQVINRVSVRSQARQGVFADIRA